MPELYHGLITGEEYNLIVKLTEKYHTATGFNILSVNEGAILVSANGEEQHRYLDNLIRLLACHEKNEWQDLVYGHFDKLSGNEAAYTYIFKDFEYASQFLRVLIKTTDLELGDNKDDFIFRSDLPYTHTYLVLEFEEQFRYVRKEDIAEWNRSINELFELGIANTPQNEIEINEYELLNEYLVYFFISGDYSASLMLNLENVAADLIGLYGSFIAIPTKGTAIVHPINQSEILELINKLHPTVEKFFNEDPGNITTNFYWFYKGIYQVFPLKKAADGYYTMLPDELSKLFNAEN